MEIIEHRGVKYYLDKGVVQSIDPPESHFGFTYWALMIPPFKPKKILMLGCGDHTIIKLIEKIYDFVENTCNCMGKDAFLLVDNSVKYKGEWDYVWKSLVTGKDADRVMNGFNSFFKFENKGEK